MRREAKKGKKRASEGSSNREREVQYRRIRSKHQFLLLPMIAPSDAGWVRLGCTVTLRFGDLEHLPCYLPGYSQQEGRHALSLFVQCHAQ